MAHYIDADRLIDKILQLQKEYAQTEVKEDNKTMRAVLGGQYYTLMEVVKIIYSLQQEQPESSNGKFVFPNFLYARTVDNKTIDVSYAPQSLDAVEYIKNDNTEHPEVDLEKEYKEYVEDDPVFSILTNRNVGLAIARHFYDIGLNARREENK